MAEIIHFDEETKEKYEFLKAEIGEVFRALGARENNKGETFGERVKGDEFARLIFSSMNAEKLQLIWQLMSMIQDAKALEEEMGISR